MPWSNDHVGMLGVIWEWLHGAGAYPVSVSIFWCCFVIDMLDLDLYRSDFNLIALTAGSMDPIGTFRVVYRWLHHSGTFLVSHFRCFKLADFYRLDLESSTSTAPSNSSVWMFCRTGG